MMVLLLACAPHVEVQRPIAAPVAPVEEARPEEKLPAFATGFHSGQQPGPAVLSSPSDAWSRVLDGPIVDPILSDGQHFFALATGYVYGLDTHGTLLWKQKAGGLAISLVPEGLAVTTPDHLLILDVATGSTLKTMDTPGIHGPAQAMEGGLVWAAKGSIQGPGWSVPLPQTSVGQVGVDGDTVYVATLEGELLALRAGTVLWHSPLPGPSISGPTLDHTGIYVPIGAEGDAPGGVLAFDRDGKERWRFRTGYQPGGTLSVGDAVWVADKDGTVYALDLQTGRPKWTAEGYGEFRTQGMWVEHSMYVGNGDGRLYRLDLFDGGVAWSVSLGAPVTGDPVVVGRLLVAGTASGRLVGLTE